MTVRNYPPLTRHTARVAPETSGNFKKGKMIVAPLVVYETIKFWLPALTVLSLVVKAYFTAKKNIGVFCDKLLTNHLSHIELAVSNTESETKKTNDLLRDAAHKDEIVARDLTEHQARQTIIWESVAKTLAVLEDRTARAARARKR